MYIEQGYKSAWAAWKYWVIPVLWTAFIALNYVMTITSDVPVDDMMAEAIEMVGKNVLLVITLGMLVALLIVVLGWTVLVHQQSLRALTTSRPRVDWKRVFFAFFLWGGITALVTLGDYWQSPEDYRLNFDPAKFAVLAAIAITMIPLQTSAEEYLFRGHMLQGIGTVTKSRFLALFLTSTMFGLMHLGNPEVGKLGYGVMVYYIGTGFFLGILTLMDEGLELALGFHAANNLVGALLVTSDWTAFQTDSILINVAEPSLGWDVLVYVFLVYPILLALFARVYRWKDWRKRLFGKVMTQTEFLALEAARDEEK